MRFDRTFYMVAMIIFALFLCTTEVYANSMTAIAEEGGTVTPSGKIIGDSGSVTITPDTLPDRYQVNDILLYEGTKVSANKLVGSVLADCNFDGLVATYNYTGLGADYTISASFVLAPVASFDIDSASPPSDTQEPDVTVQFNDMSTNNPTAWLWDFGDGTTSTEQSPSHTYTTAGIFPVTLSIYNSQSNDPVDTASMNYIVVQPTITYNASAGPNGSISPSGDLIVDEGSTTTFDITPDSLYQVTDVLVDGVSQGAVPSVTFGVADIADHTITASFEPIPVFANFTATTLSGETTTDDEFTFTDTSVGNLTYWEWYIDDALISTNQDLVYTFADAGTFNVKLKTGNLATFNIIDADYTVDPIAQPGPVEVGGTGVGYGTIMEAYNVIPTSGETIKMKAAEITEDLIFDDPVTFELKGGYDDSFAFDDGYTKIKGSVKILHGTVTVSKVIIAPAI